MHNLNNVEAQLGAAAQGQLSTRLPQGSNAIGGEKRCCEELRKYSIIPLSLQSMEVGKPVLLVDGVGELLGSTNLDKVSAGNYCIHVFDFIAEAEAALKVLCSTGPIGFGGRVAQDVNIGELPSGEGVLIFRSSGVIRPDKVYVGDTALVSFQIDDNRFRVDGRRPVALSLEWPPDVINDYFNSACDADVDHYYKAQCVARAISDTMLNTTSLNILQDELEKIPGSRISINHISAEFVLEEVEDIFLEMDIKSALPSVMTIHRMIENMSSKFGLIPADRIARGIAEHCADVSLVDSRGANKPF